MSSLPFPASLSLTHTRTRTHAHTRAHTRTHRHTQTHTDTHRHTQTHADTHTQKSVRTRCLAAARASQVLNQWVTAKRDKDWATADAIRGNLRQRGINPDGWFPASSPMTRKRPVSEMMAPAGANGVWQAGANGAWPPPQQPYVSVHGYPQQPQSQYPQQLPQYEYAQYMQYHQPPPMAAPGGMEAGTAGLPEWAQPVNLPAAAMSAVTPRRGGDAASLGALSMAGAPLLDPSAATTAGGNAGAGGYGGPGAGVSSGSALDPTTEAALDQWVEAKRRRDFEAADAIRRELINGRGVDPNVYRPKDWAGWCRRPDGGSSTAEGVPRIQDEETEEMLDRWVEAKRAKDFDLADAIREELRVHKGVNADRARPCFMKWGKPVTTSRIEHLSARDPRRMDEKNAQDRRMRGIRTDDYDKLHPGHREERPISDYTVLSRGGGSF